MKVNRKGQIKCIKDTLRPDVFQNEYTNGNISASINQITKTIKDGYTKYTYSITKPTGDTWHYWRSKHFTFKPGYQYIWKCWVRCNVCSAGTSLQLRASRLDNDYRGTKSVNICSSGLADGKWHEYTLIQTIPTTFEYGGNTLTSNPLFEIYTSNLKSGTPDTLELDFDIRDIQIIEANAIKREAFTEFNDNIKLRQNNINVAEFIEF